MALDGERFYPSGDMRDRVQSDYLHHALDPVQRRRVVDEAIERLRPMDFNTIAVSGFSGTTIGSIVADRLNKALCIVRKGHDRDSEHTHSDRKVEGPVNSRFVIVDDFIAGGNTVRRMISEITNVKIGGVCIGVYLWRDRVFSSYDELAYKCYPDAERARREAADAARVTTLPLRKDAFGPGYPRSYGCSYQGV